MNNNDTRPLMVSIWCITYNHEPYIRQCLEGFVMQKTNFRFEAIVHDDASTDGTAAIVREYAEKYPDIIKPILETENQYSKHDGSLNRIMMESCTGKYIALCEGDDYWIEPLKLQKQMDILEKNDNIGLIHTDCHILYQIDGHIEQNINRQLDSLFEIYSKTDRKRIIEDILEKKYLIRTATTLFRKDLLDLAFQNDPFAFSDYFLMGDIQIWIGCLLQKDIFYLPESTSVYRSVANSVCHQMDYKKRLKFELSTLEMNMYYINKYNFFSKDKQVYCKLKYFDYLQRYRVYYPEYKGIIPLPKDYVHTFMFRINEFKRLCKFSILFYVIGKKWGIRLYRIYSDLKNKKSII